MRRKRRRIKKWPVTILILIIIGLSVLGYVTFKDKQAKDLISHEKSLINGIKSHFSNYVITTKETKLYDENGKEIGSIGKDITLSLDDTTITKDTKNFKLKDFENTYISYKDVTKVAELEAKDDRYKVYIPYNINVKTKDKVSFYKDDDTLVYTFNSSYDLPIIIKDTNRYGVEFQDELLYIKKDDVEKTYDHHNTDKRNTNGAAVLNYHFFYEDGNPDGCNEIICASSSQFKSHLDYFKEHNILTITMHELEMYMDKKVQLPKSVLITIDDGGRTKVAVDMLTKYKMYGTIFLITSWFDPKTYYKTEYIELHSHSHNMHDGGKCPGGQGGAIKCLPKDQILSDLKASREALGGSTAFCYPFYEYNDYSTGLLKEAGFTMAFIGEVAASYGPYKLAEVGGDKLTIPRFVVVTYTTISELNRYFNEIR